MTILTLGGVARADIISDNIVDTGADLTLTAGSSTSASAAITLTNQNKLVGDPVYCDVSKGPLTLTIVPPTGVTVDTHNAADPTKVVITDCDTAYAVAFTASSGAQSGQATATIDSAPAGVFTNNVHIPITINQPAPPTSPNTAPSVAVNGVTNGASYEINHVPAVTCTVTDKEDGGSTVQAATTGSIAGDHGLGARTVTCDYTDKGGLAANTATASYTIVDTGNPTISNSLDPASPSGTNGWYTSGVTVNYTCSDPDKLDSTLQGSGVASCPTSDVLGEGQHLSKIVDVYDYAGNKGSTTVPAVNIDETAPSVSARGVTTDSKAGVHDWYTSDVTGVFTATDKLSVG